MSLELVLGTPISYIPGEGSCALFGEYYDDDGYPWPYVQGIVLDPLQAEEIGDLLGLAPAAVMDAILAHERGHVMAFHHGLLYSDEELAWRLGQEMYEGCVTVYSKVRRYALSTYS